MDTLEVATPYYKGSQKTTPPKADHKHEYVIVFCKQRIRRFDDTITTEKYTFPLPPECIDCGHVNNGVRKQAVWIEVTPQEWRKMHDERKNA